jgi:hypothetical protein
MEVSVGDPHLVSSTDGTTWKWVLGLMLMYKKLSNAHSTPYASQRCDDVASSCSFNINCNNVAHIITSTMLLQVQRTHVAITRRLPLELQARHC